MSQEIRGTLYDWDDATISELHFTEGIGRSPIKNPPKPMPPELIDGKCKITDAATGEPVLDLLAYDDVRGIVDRIQKDSDGNVLLSARWEIAVVTEFRRLVIVPNGLA